MPKPPPLLGSLANRPSYQVARQMMWQMFRSADQAARREVLDLPPAPFLGPFSAEPVRGQPIIYGYSPAVIPPPADWGADVHVTGYWFLDPAEDWTPDPALADSLQAGPPPVYVGFGSMSSRNPGATATLIRSLIASIPMLRNSVASSQLSKRAPKPVTMPICNSQFVISEALYAYLYHQPQNRRNRHPPHPRA